MPKTGYKICSNCGEQKALGDFYRWKSSKDGRGYRCKECDNARKKAEIRANPQRHSQYVKRWKDRHPEKAVVYSKHYRERNPEYALNNLRRQRERYPEKDRARRAVQRAVSEGKIVKPSRCEDCGALVEDPADLHGHHEDYSKHLDIEWLCRGCHIRGRHGK